MRGDLAEEGIDEEGDAGALQGALNAIGGRKEVGWMRVCEELGDDGRLGDDGAVVGDGGDEAALWLLEYGIIPRAEGGLPG